MPSRPWHWPDYQSCWNWPHGIATSAPREPDQNVRRWHYLKSAVVLADQRHIAEIKVREDGNGHWFYDQHLILQEKEDSPYKPGTSAKDTLPFSCGSTSAGESSPTGIIGRRNKEVKRGKHPFATEGNPAGADSAPPSPFPLSPLPSSTPSSIASWPAAPATAGSAIRWKRPSPRGEAGAGRLSRRRSGVRFRSQRDPEVRRQVPRRSESALGPTLHPSPLSPLPSSQIDGRPWRRIGFGTQLACEDCGIEYPAPEPRLYSFNSPLGACPECEGFGNVIGLDMDLIVPDPGKSLREGAIAPWNTPAYAHELKELLALAGDYDLPVDVPFRELSERHRDLIVHGVPERKFGGLDGFFAWLERRKYKMHIRVFLSRWRSYRPCPACGGMRLRPEALCARIGGRNIGEICAHEGPRRRRDVPQARIARVGTAGRPNDARTGAGQAGLSGGGGPGLSHARSHAADPQRRRGPAGGAHLGPRIEPGEHALRARRAVDRAAPPRHQPTPGRDQATPRPQQHRGGGRA